MAKNEFHTVRGYQLLHSHSKMLTPAMEDYLEMICREAGAEGPLRVGDLAQRLNVKASSATKMLQKLGLLGLINYRKYGVIALSPAGRELGEYLLRRHRTIERFLRTIGIRENLLVETELIEHNISAGTLEHLEKLNEFFARNPELLDRLNAFASDSPEDESQPIKLGLSVNDIGKKDVTGGDLRI